MYISTKSNTHWRGGTLKKALYFTRVYAKIHKQRLFLDNQKSVANIVVLRIQIMNTCFGASFTNRWFFFDKHQNLNFWWHVKDPQASCLWADFGRFW
jgi:hypothetical protein